MYVPDIELHEPATLEELVITTTRYGPAARLLAGGTDLLVDLKTGRIRATHLISLRHIKGLEGLSETDGTLRIGALTTITQMASSPIVRERFAPLLDATSQMAAPQIRNVATVGGNIASAVPCADLPPILTAMGAAVTLWSPAGERNVPLDKFFVGPRSTIRRDDEVLTAVLVPRPPKAFGAAYARFALRDGNAIAVAAVAAAIQLDRSNRLSDARIVLGAVAPIPRLVEQPATAFCGQPAGDDIFCRAAEAAQQAAEPISDVRGSAEFRRQLVGVLTRRALNAAYHRAKEAPSWPSRAS